MKKLCKICEKPLTGRQSSYCCKECQRIGSNKISCEHARKNKIIARTKKICPDCGSPLDGQQRVRCLACTEKHKKEYARQWRTNNAEVCRRYDKKVSWPKYLKKPGDKPKVLRPCRSLEIYGSAHSDCTGFIEYGGNWTVCALCSARRIAIEGVSDEFLPDSRGALGMGVNLFS